MRRGIKVGNTKSEFEIDDNALTTSTGSFSKKKTKFPRKTISLSLEDPANLGHQVFFHLVCPRNLTGSWQSFVQRC